MGRQEERLRKLHDEREKSKWYSEVARNWLDRWFGRKRDIDGRHTTTKRIQSK
jgi:hypothetical protein